MPRSSRPIPAARRTAGSGSTSSSPAPRRPRNRAQRWIRDGRVASTGARPSRRAPRRRRQSSATGRHRGRELARGRRARSAAPRGRAPRRPRQAAGLAVHPGAGRSTGTLVHHLLARYPEIAGVGGPGRPGIVHRLDRDTTGVLAVARTPTPTTASRAFAERGVGKLYLAIVYGAPPPTGEIDAAIARHPRRQRMTVRGARPRRAHAYRTLASAAGLSLLELDLHTGRTHQIRVHLKSLGHPIVGDPVYGEARWRPSPPARAPLSSFPRPALHAWRLAFAHPSPARPSPRGTAARGPASLWREVAGHELAAAVAPRVGPRRQRCRPGPRPGARPAGEVTPSTVRDASVLAGWNAHLESGNKGARWVRRPAAVGALAQHFTLDARRSPGKSSSIEVVAGRPCDSATGRQVMCPW